MKITATETPRPASPKLLSENKINKNRGTVVDQHSTVQNNDEMQELLTKLKELVPNMPKNKKLSKLEIIQYVIDYIYDLQTALESLPATGLQNCNNRLHQHFIQTQNGCDMMMAHLRLKKQRNALEEL